MGPRNSLIAARVVEWGGIGLFPILTAFRVRYPAPITTAWPSIQAFHGWFLSWFVTITVVLALLVFVAKLTQERLNPESKIRLKGVLDAVLEAYFPEVPEGERYFNRVTLFRANPDRTLLKPYARSGTQYQRGTQSLPINDDDEARNEGVAGQAWFRNATVSVNNLPACPNPWSNDDETCRRYAQEGFLPIEKAARLHVRSRSALATPVRGFKGNRWGVLVIDSRRPDAIDPTKQGVVTFIGAALGKML